MQDERGLPTSTMDTFFTNRYYWINRRLLLILGTWPHDDARNSRIRRILVLVVFMVIILVQILLLVTSDLSLKSIMDMLTYLVPCICVFISYITSYYHGKMEIMLEHIRFDWYNCGTVEEREIIEKYANLIRTFTIIVCVSTSITTISVISLAPLTYLFNTFSPLNETQTRELPFNMELLLDYQEHILCVTILLSLLLCLTAVTTAGTFLLFMIYVTHVCGMLEIIGYMLKHLFDVEEYNLCTSKDVENIMTRLIRCISCHERTTRYICTINSLYNVSNLIAVTLTFVMILLGFTQIISVKNIAENIYESIIAFVYISNVFSWMFICSFIGQILLNKSRDLLDNAYAASWYMVPYKVQKLLIMILMKSKRYSSLRICSIFEMSFQFFIVMVQNAMSYAIILHSLR